MDTAQTKAIKRRAADILKQYRQLARLAGEPIAPYTSPLTQGMPTIDGERIGHRSHDGMDFAGMLTEIDIALLALTPKRRDVLAYAYCTREHLKLPELAKSMHIHNPRVVSYVKQMALIDFAKAYRDGELLTSE